MKLKLERPLAIFDLEATGLNISKDRIVEIAIIKIHPDGSEETFASKVNPEMEIPDEVSKIHGIYDKDVADAPKLGDLAQRIVDFVGDADLGGYNSNKFDIPMLAEEMLRVGSDFKMEGRHFVDVQNIFHKMEQRTLAAAYQFYCHSELTNSHSALVDTTATWKVLQSQLEKYPDLKAEVPFLADFSKAGNQHILDFAGRLAVNENGDAVYNFGKHKGKTVKQVNEDEPGYYGWFVSESTDFPKYTKQKLTEEMDKIKSEIRAQKEAQKEGLNKKKNVQKEPELSLDDKLNALKQKFGK